jgi:RNA polymerase sigma-70 factor, ECF subfamily
MCRIEWNDQDLVKSYVGGNETALQLLLEKHQSQIFHYILSKIKNRDLSNDIFSGYFY